MPEGGHVGFEVWIWKGLARKSVEAGELDPGVWKVCQAQKALKIGVIGPLPQVNSAHVVDDNAGLWEPADHRFGLCKLTWLEQDADHNIEACRRFPQRKGVGRGEPGGVRIARGLEPKPPCAVFFS